MAFETIITIQAEVIGVDDLVKKAASCLSSYGEKTPLNDRNREFVWFLDRVANESVFQGGSKGTMLLFGGVFNHPRVDAISKLVADFIRASDGSWAGAIILSWETEQSRNRTERVFWFNRGLPGEHPKVRRLLFADATNYEPKWCWGLAAVEGPPSGFYLKFNGDIYVANDGDFGQALLRIPDSLELYENPCACQHTKAFEKHGAVECDHCGHRVPIITIREA